MAAVSAEGEGNRFIAMAVETSEPVPLDRTITEKCKHVTFSGGNVRGGLDIVDAPRIRRVQTLGTHRTLETTIGGTSHSGELYDYVAYMGRYLVLVTANPLIVPNQPVARIDVARAQRLLTDAVNAIRR
jgi:Domain of unknown function (DUF5642)